jgi:hypothetical protein
MSDVAAGTPGARERLSHVRKNAITACLGSASQGAERSGAPDPPITVAPTRIGAHTAPLPTPSLTPPAPPLTIPRPAAITTCDPGGCWDSEGRRLNIMGPLLVGPGGTCNVHPNVVTCP